MAIHLPPPTALQAVDKAGKTVQAWQDWFFRVQALAGTLSTLTLPAELSITYVGDVGALVWAVEPVHTAFMGPLSGSPAIPTFRVLDTTDMPKWVLESNVIGSTETLTIPADYSLVVVDYLTVNGTLDNSGNVGIL